MTDDWGIWLSLQERDLLESLRHVGFEQPGRPLAGLYYVLLYDVIDDRPWLHGALIGSINAGVVVAGWWTGRRFLPSTALWPALVVMALAPNHAMTRIWFVAGYYPLALILVLVGLGLLSRNRVVWSAVSFTTAALLFEGVLGLGLVAVALWAVPDPRRRVAKALAVGLPTLVALGAAYAFSSKRGRSLPFNNVDSLFGGQLGVGLWGSVLLARVAGGIALGGIAWALVRHLPSFRSDRPEPAVILVGAALTAGGAGPFVLTGATFATTGVFDRNNLAASVGVAVIFGGLFSALWRTAAPIAVAAGISTVVVFAAGQVEDLRNWSDAYERGEEVISRVSSSDLDDARPVLVVPEQEAGNTGMADFIYDTDLIGALRHRIGGDWGKLRLIEGLACEGNSSGAGARVQVFDWRTGRWRWMTQAEIIASCEDLRVG